MPYNVRFTDQDKTDLTVFDLVGNTDTSLVFPGRNSTNYGQVIAENFLHLLENFASSTAPTGAIEGQLWYDSADGSLKISDGVTWKAASGILKGPSEPSQESSKEGELWIDTANQQLRIFNGSRWILVGPTQSYIDGLKYGPSVENIVDTDDIQRSVVIFYVADVPVSIVSKDSFRPKLTIPGYTSLRAGINISSPLAGSVLSEEFEGGFLPRLNGVAVSADALKIPNVIEPVPAARFLRSDIVNSTDFAFNVKSNSGITLGLDQNFNLSNTTSGARIYNSAQNSVIDLQINRNGVPDTILRIQDNRVGINNPAPSQALDVVGNIALTGILSSSNTTDSTNLSNGSLRLSGGASILKNLRVGANLIINGNANVSNIEPNITDTYNSGTDDKRWNQITAKTIKAETIEGVLVGNIAGKAALAAGLEFTTTFKIGSLPGDESDVVSNTVSFNGQTGGFEKIFSAKLTDRIIINKPEPPGRYSKKTDYVLLHRPSTPGDPTSGLLKQTRDDFVGDLGLPIGAIIPFAGPNAPRGFLLCDGSEVEIAAYPDLWRIIGNIYNGSLPLLGPTGRTFRLPDLRGRFALGRADMDNNIQIPVTAGGFVDGGGGPSTDIDDPTQPRVPGADTLAVAGGNSTKAIAVRNLPDHVHDLQADDQQFYTVRNDTAITPSAVPGLGPTAVAQTQYLNDSGGVKSAEDLGQKFNVMNPYLVINYIIRSGPSEFETVSI